MSAVDDLVAYVRAQLAERERVARRVADRYIVRNPDLPSDGQPFWPLPSVEACFRGRIDPDILAGLELIKANDPASVLADIAAKRAILDLHSDAHECTEMRTGTYPANWPEEASWGKAGEPFAHPSNEYFEAYQPCPTVRLLARSMPGGEGWREEWAT